MKKILMVIMVVVMLTSCDAEFIAKYNFDDYDKFLEVSKSLKDRSEVVAIDVVEEMKVEDVKNVDIELTSENLYIVTEKRDTIKIHYFGLFLDKKLTGPEVEIKTKSTFSLDVNHKNGFEQSKAIAILYLPEDYIGDLEIYLTSGNIDMEEVLAEDIYISITSGNVNFKNIESNDLSVNFTSGNIGGDNIKGENVEFKGTSGNVDVEIITGDSLNIRSTSGNNYIKEIDMEDTNVKLSSGNINFKEINGNMNIKATSGTINIGLSKTPNYNVDLYVTSGNIRFNFELDEIKVDKEDKLSGILGSGKYDLKIETSSGNITIK